ncbi:MAG: hypothetical protein ABJ143_10300, partial [Parasphingorhabdus sp.]|uniref:hypothetical protein n=1 Tax=Parasphingorhabdus sp. TaxID=2709688 RepID=UPI00329886A3
HRRRHRLLFPMLECRRSYAEHRPIQSLLPHVGIPDGCNPSRYLLLTRHGETWGDLSGPEI